MNKYLYLIKKLQIKPWIKYWLVNKEKKKLPNTYQQVEYIESTGTQYIDTRVVPTINTKARVKFAPTMFTGHGYFGARYDPERFCCTTFESASYFGVGMSVSTWPANRTFISLDTIYDCVFGNGYANINGTNYTETVYSSFGDAGSFKLSSYREEKSSAKYYLCQMWENDILIFYGIPCYRKLDNVAGMYDIVNNVFYTNEGDGDFVVGADV